MITERYLVCITTCRRPAAVKAFIREFIEYCQNTPDADLLVSIDGKDTSTQQFLQQHHIPYLCSDEREGVGLSKNRVLKEFIGEYEYFFFFEDDVRLLDTALFSRHIEISKKYGLHHLNLFPQDRIISETDNSYDELITCEYGSAQVGFYTRKGLLQVGGFHTLFAKYKRYGHTEHTYRYFRSGLSDSPFIMIRDAIQSVGIYHPIPATRLKTHTDRELRLFIGEKELMEHELSHFPITTISSYKISRSPTEKEYLLPRLATWNLFSFIVKMRILDFFRLLKRQFVK